MLFLETLNYQKWIWDKNEIAIPIINIRFIKLGLNINKDKRIFTMIWKI